MPRALVSNAFVDVLLFPAMYLLCVCAFNAATEQEGRKQFISLDDDDNFVVNHGYKGFTQEHLEWMWTAKHLDVWEPVAWFFKAIIWNFFGTDEEDSAQGWLNSQILFHSAGAFVLFLVVRLLLREFNPHATASSAKSAESKQAAASSTASQRTGASDALITAASFFGALFWAIHPLRGETLGWISCSSYNIGSAFVFGSLYCYTMYVKTHIAMETSGSSACRAATCAIWYSSTAVLYFLGIACKTPAVAILIVFPVVDAYLKPNRIFPPLKWLSIRGGFFDKIPFASIAIWCVQKASPGDDACGNERTPGVCLSAFEKFVRGMWALCFYVRMTIWPVQHQPHYALQKGPLDLSVNDYILPVIVVVVAVAVSVFLFVQFVLSVAAVGTHQQRAALVTPTTIAATLCLVYVAMSVPSLGFIQHGVPTMAADRYNYFSGGWVAVAAALLFLKVFGQEPVGAPLRRVFKVGPKTVGVVGVVLLLLVLTRATTRAWTNTKSLYTYTLRFRDGASGFALNNYGYYFYAREEWSNSERITKQAVMVDPTQLKATINLADIYQYRTNEIQKAIETYEQGLEHSPRSGSLVNNLVVAYAKIDDIEMADHMHSTVPLMQADWSEDADETMAWALAEKERLRKILIPPNVPKDSLSAVQKKLNAQCWQKPGRSAINCLPSFAVLGAPRAATTTLYDLLKQHKQIMMWQSWNRRDYLTKTFLYERAYAESFPTLSGGVDAVVADFSSNLFLHFDGPRRMKLFAGPDTKLVVAVRNPALRAFSHWKNNQALGVENRTFMAAFREEASMLANPVCFDAATAMTAHDVACYPLLRHSRSHFTIRDLPTDHYLSWGLYNHQIHNWLDHFPLEQFTFVDSSSLADKASATAALNAITDFVGLETFSEAAPTQADGAFPPRHRVARGGTNNDAQLNARTLRMLGQFFEAHNQAFYETVGHDFGWEKEILDLISQLERSGSGSGSRRYGSSSPERSKASSNRRARGGGASAAYAAI